MKNLSLFKLNMYLFAEFNLDKFIIFNRITEMLLKKTIPMFLHPDKEYKNMGIERKNNASLWRWQTMQYQQHRLAGVKIMDTDRVPHVPAIHANNQ
ncbi:hypothetical protein Undi14_07780 [Undibacterium sp. 14-3-2]|jgi:hypothetical protein|uniref:hypothetical protein n=1 Tax=Undibacterium sp. 14-3-2 TaxID=2800129 RepID=UPI001906092A|nr:hypothetical protein [Undibacterium sp. 14-3-2]MBK1889935.1 hypothetical protein [Undibacterium sp. 14-3-2]